MESQRTFADVEAASVTRQTRRARFLQRMEGLAPWQGPAARMRPRQQPVELLQQLRPPGLALRSIKLDIPK